METAIMLNCRSEEQPDKNEYLLFNTVHKTQTIYTASPEHAKDIAAMYNYTPISPMQAISLGAFDFEEVGLGDFIDLPF